MVTEEGIVISENELKKFQFSTYQSQSVKFGAQQFPLNLYEDNGQKEQ
jgi:hypothetical protein